MSVRIAPRTFPDGDGGTVSGVVAYPDGPSQALSVVLAHGAGSDMNSTFLVFMQERLVDAGYRTVRFNFPYKERGGRVPDRAPILERCFRSVVAEVRKDLGSGSLVIGGRSMGCRMATHLAAAGEEVAGLLLFGYPLHPPGQPTKLRSAHLPKIAAPMLFFVGTRDEFCTLGLLGDAVATLRAPATVHVINDGDHSFVVRRKVTGRSIAQVNDEIAATTIEWLGQLAERE